MQFWILIDAFLNIVDAIVGKLKGIKSFFAELMDSKYVVLFIMGLTLLGAQIMSWIRGSNEDDYPETDTSKLDAEMSNEGHTVSDTSKSKIKEATRNSGGKPNLKTPNERKLDTRVDTPEGGLQLSDKQESKVYTKGIDIPAAPQRIISETDVEVQKLAKRHPGWKVSSGVSDRKGNYPGCPSHGVRGTVNDYDSYILLSINTLMSKAGLDVNAACGLTGCLMAESGLFPLAFNRTEGGYGAQGIAQWRGWNKDPKVIASRGRGRIGNYVHLFGVMPCYDDNIHHQLDFVCWELSNYSYLRVSNGQSLRDATYQGYTKYEGAIYDPHASFASRYKCAQKAYNLYVRTHQSGGINITLKEKRVVNYKYRQ